MASTASPAIGNSKVRQLALRFDELAYETSPEPTAKVVFTGESRVPLRERIQRMRSGKATIPAPLYPSKPSTSSPPRTPPIFVSVPECPPAPRKGKVHDIRRLSQHSDTDDDDVLLDRKANEQPAGTFLDVSRRSGAITPGRRSPLRQSWGPDQLAKIDAKLQELIHGSAVYGDEKGEKSETQEDEAH
ncbi:hypothetical protein HD806DRAFT_543904 [Xylariaceae sp. AK1471]|nr:hypothetical protein HD806DRAFT_543904 [Xylariaceae sp. AK1471]